MRKVSTRFEGIQISNETGKTFGRWTVVKLDKVVRGKAMWLCQCECGTLSVVNGCNLRNGISKSCGCLSRERTIERCTIHGKSPKRVYSVWVGMKDRCTNESSKYWERYGGRGITICDEWLNDYISFRNWSLSHGYAPHLSIDRIDNDSGYSPENCRWATRIEQGNNRRVNVILSAFGEQHTIGEWSRDHRCVVDYRTLWYRTHVGKWNAESAITTVASYGNKPQR